MPATEFEPQKPKLVYLPVKQIAAYHASQRLYEYIQRPFALPARKLILAFGVQNL